ncbi:MAG TPA: hypothetical protein VNT51_10720 [Miltoncostaeaceae bacterium]|jgi:hypothetical protein|nr:hypothetical protein [Miltoncostaeaceae bacterium]
MGERTKGKLPRRRGVAKPGPDEKVRWNGGADLQNGWWGRHGTLHLTDDRLVFVPTLLDGVLGGRRHEMRLEHIRQVERWPEDPTEIPRGGRRPRMLIHTDECVYQLMTSDLDGWIDAIEKVYVLRARRGETYRPTFRRRARENLMLAEE